MARGRGGRGRGGSGGSGHHGAGGFGGLGYDQAALLRQLTAEVDAGRGGRGGGRGGRGGRGGGGGFNSYNTSGASTPGSDSGRGSFRGRGGGRGRGRGGAHSMRNQNAVGFDYGTVSSKARVHDARYDDVDAVEDSGDDGDVILQPHKTYEHTVRPHLENGSASPPSERPQEAFGVGSSSRASSNLADLERAQRIQTGQVASLIPTGPKAAQIYRFYGTENALKKPRNVPTPYRSLDDIENTPAPQPSASKSRFKVERPPPDPFEDACLGGIPKHMRNRNPRHDRDRDQFPSYPKASVAAPSFVKAEGEWRDGKWIRASDGKVGLPSGSDKTLQDTTNTSSSQDRSQGAGLGFTKPPDQHTVNKADAERAVVAQPSVAANTFDLDAALLQLNDADAAGSDSIDALLQAFPGSSELQAGDAVDSTLDFYAPQNGFQPSVSVTDTKIHTPATKASIVVDDGHEDDDDDDDDEEVILVANKASPKLDYTNDEGSADAAVSDAPIHGNNIANTMEEDGFVVDLVGDEGNSTLGEAEQKIQYEALDNNVIGEPSKAEESEEVSDFDDVANAPAYAQAPRPGGGRKARNAAKKARRRARQIHVQEPAIPREGDSDLEWGSDGPPPVQFKDDDAQEMFDLDQLRLAETPQNPEDEERLLAIALAKSVADSEASQQPRQQSKSARKSHKDLLLEDYMANAMNTNDSSDEELEAEVRDDAREHEPTDLDAMISFMNSMDGQRKGRETTMEDIAADRRVAEEDNEWETESEGSSRGEGSGSSSNDDVERAVQREERRIMEGEEASDSESEDIDSDDDDDDDEESSDEDEDEDEDDEDDEFERNFTWADEDEDFIERLDKFAQANKGILTGRNRAARNKLFKAIESGDFTGIDSNLIGGVEDADLANDPVFADQTAPRGKQARKKKWKNDDLWAAELQEQWEKDRSKKADNKRKRAEQRALAADNPFHNTNGSKGKPGGKKAAKKAARAERRAQKQVEHGVLARSKGAAGGWDDDIMDLDDRLDVLKRHARSIVDVNEQIVAFLNDIGKTTLSMPPMDKHARAQVHQLAMCYSLKSQSQGSGSKRFTTLTKTSRSGLNVKQSKVNGIVRRATGSLGINGKGPNRTGGADKPKRGEKPGPVPRNVEGAAVGFGAERIGEDNIGHRLLSAMGWTEGTGVGATRGMSDPVGATIKISRGGLGF